MVECDGLQIRIRKDTGGSNPLLCSKLELIFSILKKLRILKREKENEKKESHCHNKR